MGEYGEKAVGDRGMGADFRGPAMVCDTGLKGRVNGVPAGTGRGRRFCGADQRRLMSTIPPPTRAAEARSWGVSDSSKKAQPRKTARTGVRKEKLATVEGG